MSPSALLFWGWGWSGFSNSEKLHGFCSCYPSFLKVLENDPRKISAFLSGDLIMKVPGTISILSKLSIIAHACNPRTQKVEAGGLLQVPVSVSKNIETNAVLSEEKLAFVHVLVHRHPRIQKNSLCCLTDSETLLRVEL